MRVRVFDYRVVSDRVVVGVECATTTEASRTAQRVVVAPSSSSLDDGARDAVVGRRRGARGGMRDLR